MALDPRTTRAPHGAGPETKADVTAFVDHVKENPVLYVAAVAFLIVCAIIGVAFRAYRAEANQAGATAYARALDTQLPAARAEALADVSPDADWLEAESLYMAGEAAFDAGDLEKAKSLFEQLRADHSDYEFTPDAVEALGAIAEEQEDYAAAIARYEEVRDVWPDSFAARRQPMNIGRAQEAAESYEAAVAAYREQLDVFPGSNVALRAQQALDRLRETRPALFPEEAAVAEPVHEGLTSPLDIDLNIDPVSGPLEDEMPEDTATPDAAPDSVTPEAAAPDSQESPVEAAPLPDAPEAAAEVPEVDSAVDVEAPDAQAADETVDSGEEESSSPAEESAPGESAVEPPQG